MTIEIRNAIGIEQSALESCAKLYCDIWREPPWNEDFWKEENVLIDMEKQLQKDDARAYFALCDEKVVGFTWGYIVSPNEMNVISNTDFWSGEDLFYIDELAVKKGFRSKGLGKQLTLQIISGLKHNAVLRTDQKAQAAREVYRNCGFSELPVIDGVHASRSYWIRKLKLT
ncbi:MAG: hypothetical protein CR972_03765 [Candidatus Moraniibacteriota bacterium]|nr:MAG: hypothetical protein CR972_03765 [Candidatus Moranbacteria bacterium]